MIRKAGRTALAIVITALISTGCIEYGPPGRPKTIPQAITLMISSNTVSNYTPCGCHVNKWGGMPRRGSIFQAMEDQIEWDVLFVDTGDIVQGVDNASYALKDGFIFQAYRVIGYDVVNVGLNEVKLGYDKLAEYAVEDNIPWVSANTYGTGIWPDLPPGMPGARNQNATNAPESSSGNPGTSPEAPATPNVPDAQPLFQPYRIIEPPSAPGFRIGFIGMMIQDAGRLNPERERFSFEPCPQAIRNTVEKLRNVEKVDLIVLLCDADTLETIDAGVLFEGVDIVIGGVRRLERSPNYNVNPLNPLYREGLDPRNQATGSQPPSNAPQGQNPQTENEEESEYVIEPIPTPLIVPKGSGRGRMVNRLDISFDPAGRIIDYYIEEIGVDEKWGDDPRMAEVSRGFDTQVLSQELIQRVQLQMAGSAACENCHPGFLAAWADFGHFSSYDTIVEGNALGDASCTKCHAIGFTEEPRFLTYDFIPEEIRNVGCEGCHPNGQRHINLQHQLANRSPEMRAQTQAPDAMASQIVAETCTACHTGEWGEGFDFVASMASAREICTSVPPPPPGWEPTEPVEETPE